MRSALLAILAGCVLVFAGCIDYQETITLNDDGSGTIAIRYAMDKEFLAQTEQFADSTSEDESEIPSEEEIRESIKSTKTSVELISYKESEDEKWKIWEMEFSFDRLSDFDRLGMELSEEGYTEGSSEPQRKYEKQPDGTWLFSYKMGSAGFGSDGSEDDMMMPSDSAYAEAMRQMQESMEEYEGDDEYTESDYEYDEESEMPDTAMDFDDAMEQFAAGMQQMMAGASEAKIKMTVNFPGKVTESNATKVEGNTAVWEAGLMDAPESMTATIKP
jgi:hypothetical protein